jgi:hypothetical protein
MSKRIFIITLLIAICFSSCRKNKQLDDAMNIVNAWTGKTIRFPRELSCISMEKDTACIDLYSNNFKILLYVDSQGCTSCRLKLSNWKKIMADSDTIFSKKPEFIFIFQPKKSDEEDLQYIFKVHRFRHPVFIIKKVR